jgi:hypothetical protein
MYDREGWALLIATFAIITGLVYLIPRIIG